MEPGSSSGPPKKPESVRTGKRLGSMLQNIEPFVARTDHNPVELRTWAKRTGYVSTTFSLDRNASSSDRTDSSRFDLEKGADQIGGSSEIDPIHGRTKLRRVGEIEPVLGSGNKSENAMGLNITRNDNQSNSNVNEASLRRDRDKEKKDGLDCIGHANGNGGDVKENSSSVNGIEGGRVQPLGVEPLKKDDANADGGPEMYGHPYSQEPSPDLGWSNTRLELKCGLRDKPGVVPAIYYGLQHYLSLAGSLIFIPLIIVPTMGGSDKDVATVISTMFMVTGITTLINSYFGTRLPLVQGSSFVYLAPALVIMNARDFRNLSEHKFKHIMRELQGAIIIGSIFQCILGLTGLMSLFLRLINPVVVAPCIAAVGLAFFSYGFPQAGECVEISLPVILLVLIFALYLRGISIFGHRIFRIYAVPLSIVIIWAYAFFLTAGGAYNYKGCSPDIPTSNILLDSCRRHVNTMRSCRTDVSNAWKTAAWVRVPYPLQWGIPVFHLRTSLIMIFVSLVASVDSVGIYHSTSMLVSSHPPTPAIVSRGIAVEGFCSILAGLWGSGTGSTTLTENIHTIRVTRVANRSAVEVGALFFIFFSFIGKVGAILASIPLSLAAAMLCFIWALIVALGLSNLQYGTASFRNMTVVGVSLFLGLSIPAYFQQYQPQTLFMLPSYLIPYSAASDGPVSTGNRQIDFAINGLMSMNMVVTLLVALVLDNSVPGSKEERGVYKWSRRDDLANDPSLLQDYSLPKRVARVFCWSRCLGV